MNYKVLHNLISIVLTIFSFLSCTQRPEISELWIPSIVKVDARVNINEVTLSAEVASEYGENLECGFFYGKATGDFERMPSEIKGKIFSVVLPALDYDSEYEYYAFVSNGQNSIKSKTKVFKTDEEPYLHIPSTEKSFPASASSFAIEVGGNTEFEVVLPSECDWVDCEKNDRKCTFYIDENKYNAPRSCKVIFRGMTTDCRVTLMLKQEGRRELTVVSSEDVELAYDAVEFSVITETVDMYTSKAHIPEGVEWVSYGYGINTKYVFIVEENASSEDRSTEILIIDNNNNAHQINLTQAGKPYVPEGGYTLELPFDEKFVGYEQSEFSVEVGGNAKFEVIVINAGWIQYRLEDRKCIFTVSQNTQSQQRSTFVVFNSLSHQYALSFDICQSPAPGADLKPQYDTVTLQYHYSSFYMKYEGKTSPGYVWSGEWAGVMCTETTKYFGWDGELFVECKENSSYDERTCVALIEDDKGGQYPLTIVQKAWCSIMKFEDPEMEQACVDAFDTDGDGKLTFYEVASVRDMSRLDLEGRNITSFAEFYHFTNATLPDGLFAGTGIKRVFFHLHQPASSGKRTFMNCTGLTDVNMGVALTVQDQAFMGCTGLKNVCAIVCGESAFEDCTGLETVVQMERYSIPKRAFKNCKSLYYVKFPLGIQTDSYIGEEAFFGCTTLESIILPEFIVEINDRAFANCLNLTSVYIEARTIPALGTDVFAGTSSELKIYVHPQMVSQYKFVWPSLADRIFPIEL